MAEIPDGLWAGLDPLVPIALLPVRLETRFGTRDAVQPDGTTVPLPVLRVRIYPDDVSVVSTSPGLDPVELASGTAFWAAHEAPPTAEEAALPGALEHRRRAAWEVLVRSAGRERASFVARSTAPGAPAPPARVDGPATARLLPDSWVIVGHRGGQRVLSAFVPRPPADLQVGPSRAQGADAFDPDDAHLLRPDDGLRWLSEFDAAEQAGMAATIDLATTEQVLAHAEPPVATLGVETLTVIGIREPGAGRSVDDEAASLADLLMAHAARDRAAFVPQGSPTNQLADRPSAWSSSPDIFEAYERLVGAAAPAPATGVSALRGGADNATTLEAALGLPGGLLGGLDAARETEQWWARAMARALFPVTVGEVIGTLVRPAKAEDQAFERLLDRLDGLVPFAAEHVASFVRGRGPLPVFRVGRQPYGVLPITPLRRWVRRDREPQPLDGLATLLGLLRPFWEHAASRAPMLDGSAANAPDATARLVRILGLGPVPHPGGYLVRSVTGELGEVLYSMSRPPIVLAPDPIQVVRDAGVQQLISQDVRVAGYRSLLAMTLGDLVHGTHLEAMELHGAKPLRVPVARTDPNRAGWESPAIYLRRLTRDMTLFRLVGIADGDKPRDLLFHLVEHAMALSGELDTLLLLRHAAPAAATGAARVSPEVLSSGLAAARDAVTAFTSPISGIRQELDPVLPGGLAASSALEIAADDDRRLAAIEALGLPKTHLSGFPGTRDAVNALADGNLTDDAYTRLVGETLATSANRLDAWITSLATQRLESLRAERATGIQLGSWGLLVDARPRGSQPAVAPAGWLPADGDQGAAGAAVARGPLLAPGRQVGYVHAPSLAQARTAGVLRAGELSHGTDASSIAAMDLTSARVRAARDVLEAVREGQPLGAVLGYRLERRLGDAGLHGAVDRLRAAYPQRRAEGAVGEPAAGSDAVVPPEVVDGLEVWQHADRAAAEAGLAPGDARFASAMADLELVVDAVADLIVAEGVHHITSGRAEAAGATFTAVAEGGQPPLDLAVIREPRSGNLDHAPRPARARRGRGGRRLDRHVTACPARAGARAVGGARARRTRPVAGDGGGARRRGGGHRRPVPARDRRARRDRRSGRGRRGTPGPGAAPGRRSRPAGRRGGRRRRRARRSVVVGAHGPGRRAG